MTKEEAIKVLEDLKNRMERSNIITFSTLVGERTSGR